MRGASHTLSRLNVAQTAVAAVLVLATSMPLAMPAAAKSLKTGPGPEMTAPQTQPSNGLVGESVAYAIPRNTPPDGVEVALPQPLLPSDVAFYHRALTLQKEGAFAAADKMLARVSDKSLIGCVLAQRYLSDNYTSNRAELTAWWAEYANNPEAPAIYGLMQHKFPRADLPPAPHPDLLPEQTAGFRGAATPSSGGNSESWRRSFVVGLNDWKQGNIEAAQAVFAQTANKAGISDDEHAASAFWAARAALRLHDPVKYMDWLHQASWNGGTFYGMLAARLLGQTAAPSSSAVPLTEADVTAVDSLPQGHLAFALLQVGMVEDAQKSLRALWPQIQTTPGLGQAVMAVSARAGLVGLTVALANNSATTNELAGVRLPMPSLFPKGGFSVNPALVYALTRTESGFDPDARSAVGARGLMQLMPETAHLMRTTNGISGSLSDPSANLAIGQAYIKYLADLPSIKGNLLSILASYNAGPNAAAAWYGKLNNNSDPLLFIETIPNTQTRHFVFQVMADSWIYAAEIGMQPKSLDQLAEGNFPTLGRFTPLQPTIETADAQ